MKHSRYNLEKVAHQIICAIHPSYYCNPNGHIKAKEVVVQFVEIFEACGGDIYHRDHQGRTFLDVLPTDNDEWMVLDPALDPWRIKMQRHRLNEEVKEFPHFTSVKGRKI